LAGAWICAGWKRWFFTVTVTLTGCCAPAYGNAVAMRKGTTSAVFVTVARMHVLPVSASVTNGRRHSDAKVGAKVEAKVEALAEETVGTRLGSKRRECRVRSYGSVDP
jgi:hypothetical protein